ncbi:hypothetical protein [Aequorivita sp. CIP111184]|nr:hypothetical protein [Aequorivita sp. CIP111184]SRX52743.1 hypothetical protein AEQU1_00613 [Aequorivita sp. CIP111184]
MEKSTTKQRSIRLKESFILKIESMAEEENRTFNNMVETLLIKATQQSTC